MNPAVRRRVLGLLTYGLYVLASRFGDEVAAGTVSWLSQASFNPPLVMTALRVGSRIQGVVDRGGAFAVSILSRDQKEVAESFFKPSKIEPKRINGYPVEPGPKTGAPILANAPAWFEARVVGKLEKGDHTVYLAEVVECGLRDPGAKPLILHETGWRYGG